jgi:leucine dehydrogenase
MQITEIPTPGYEKVVRCRDAQSGLHALISVHDTTLGPALGGMRMLPYATEEEALEDVNRLSRGMTYKSAVARTGLGGGKSVVIGDPKRLKTEALFLAMGRFIEALGGKYITAEDMNIGIADLEIVRRETRYVTGLSRESGSSGNPSPYTARGCLVGIQTVARELNGSPELRGLKVAIQGIGAVGGRLGELLLQAGADVRVTDIDADRVTAFCKRTGAKSIDESEFYRAEVDILSPCARGKILNDHSIPLLRCRAVAGAANNQLDRPDHADRLSERGILYSPDYVINGGGIINVACELLPGGYDEAEALRRVDGIGATLAEVFALAKKLGVSTAVAADRVAEQRLAEGRAKKA